MKQQRMLVTDYDKEAERLKELLRFKKKKAHETKLKLEEKLKSTEKELAKGFSFEDVDTFNLALVTNIRYLDLWRIRAEYLMNFYEQRNLELKITEQEVKGMIHKIEEKIQFSKELEEEEVNLIQKWVKFNPESPLESIQKLKADMKVHFQGRIAQNLNTGSRYANIIKLVGIAKEILISK